MSIFSAFGFKALLIILGAFAILALTAAGSAEAKSKRYYRGGIYAGSGAGISVGTRSVYGKYYRPRAYYPRRYWGRTYYPPRYYPRRLIPAYPYAPPLALYPRRSTVYVGPARTVPIAKNGLVPFTPDWYTYCARKYKSFDPRTGTYLAYSGTVRYCR
ncbi:BA14K family protein [Roseibium sp. RKSG952]|uniref:BA14K family protein n=1 Tax=Roseibium sp. RKSG952 TaxID=2529384 RepID=UPI001AD8BFDF|nr:BA14K family protein [Roseibium sp. RKSG952]